MFTLGFASADKSRLNAIDFCASVTGPVSIGLLVGYLPALYAAYARRETEVTMLEARAGGPAWGPEILARYAIVDLNDQLSDLYRGWERWTADVSESHTSYPILIYFRSPRAQRNWLIALLAVMDAAALHVAFNPSQNVGEIRMALRSGYVTLREIARTERVPYNPDPSPNDPIQLTYEEFLYSMRLEGSGIQLRTHAEGGVAAFPGLARELRSGGLCAGIPDRRRPGPLVGTAADLGGADRRDHAGQPAAVGDLAGDGRRPELTVPAARQPPAIMRSSVAAWFTSPSGSPGASCSPNRTRRWFTRPMTMPCRSAA